MSIEVMSWVLNHSDETLGRRLTLLALADFTNSDGSGAWPSVDTLAERTRLSRRQVQRSLKDLRASGAIVDEGKSPAKTVIWRVVMKGDNLSKALTERVTSAASGDVVNVTQTVNKEPSVSPSSPPENPMREIFDYWRKTMAHPGALLDEARRRLIERAFKHSTPADCRRAIDGCASSDFHMARGEYKGGRRYDGLKVILRDREQVETFMQLAPQSKIAEEEKKAIIAVRTARDLSSSREALAKGEVAWKFLLDRGWDIRKLPDDSLKFHPPANSGQDSGGPPL